MIRQFTVEIATSGRGTYDITSVVQQHIASSGLSNGLCNIFIKHTSASLTLSENADPDVMRDLETFMARIAPDGDPDFVHTAEGPDDMPAHIRSILTRSDLQLPVNDGRCALGTWQGIYVWEHRRAAHTRQLVISVFGD